MMKKLIGIMLVVLLLTGAAALAEDDFRLHSGVRFGMTAEEAIAAAEAAGNTFVLNEDGRLASTNEILLAEYPIEVYFDLDEEGRVARQQYVFTWSMNQAPVQGKKWQVDAEELTAALVKTYGDVMGDDDLHTAIPLPAPMAGPVAESVDWNGSAVPLAYYSIYRQWLVPNDADFVAVELYQMHYIWNMRLEAGTKTYIDYTPYTQAEIDAAAEEAEKAAQEAADAYYSGF